MDKKIRTALLQLGSKADLLAFYSVVKDTSTAICVMKSQGASAEEVVDEGLGDEYEPWEQGFINEERWIETVFVSYPR